MNMETKKFDTLVAALAHVRGSEYNDGDYSWEVEGETMESGPFDLTKLGNVEVFVRTASGNITINDHPLPPSPDFGRRSKHFDY